MTRNKTVFRRFFAGIAIAAVSGIIINHAMAFQTNALVSDAFNTTEKNVGKNGNFLRAVKKVLSMKEADSWTSAESVSADELSRKPYASMGKLCKIKVLVMSLQDFPKSPNIPGSWSELLTIVPNQNSPHGFSTLSFIYQGDPGNIRSNDEITIVGYFIGTYESPNSIGGVVECLSLVGNSYQR